MNKIQRKTLKRLIISTIFLVIGLLFNLLYKKFDFEIGTYISSLFLLISYIICVKKVFIKTIMNVRKLNVFDENFLMLVASIVAFFIDEKLESIIIILFYEIGELLQGIAVENSRKKINDLINIRPDYANLKIDENKIEKCDPSDLKIGDIIVVKPGEKIPLDAVVIKGSSSLDVSSITGESMPIIAEYNDSVYSGSINIDSVLELKVTSTYYNSTATKILDLIENASLKKSKSEKFITKFSKIYTPIVVLITVLIAIVPPMLFNLDFVEWIYRALTILVISCPCALVISVPLSFFSAIGTFSKLGILVKGGNYIDTLSKIKIIMFDKTGTLTDGVFNIESIEKIDESVDENNLVELVYAAEYYTSHTIGKSIKTHLEKNYLIKINESDITDFKEIIGYGVKLKYKEIELIVGNKKLMEKYNFKINDDNDLLNTIYIMYDGKILGNLKLVDNIKKNAYETIKELKKLGIEKTIMLTGDKENVANYISNKLEIDECYSKLLPTDKIEILERKIEENKNKKTMFVGDGLNDILSIARADVGVSMGKLGSGATIELADVVIMNDEINKIVDAIKISKQTIFIAKQNIFLAIFIKILILILSILFNIEIWFAIFADVGVTLITIINSLRIMNFKSNK